MPVDRTLLLDQPDGSIGRAGSRTHPRTLIRKHGVSDDPERLDFLPKLRDGGIPTANDRGCALRRLWYASAPGLLVLAGGHKASEQRNGINTIPRRHLLLPLRRQHGFLHG
ncbi:hypothetical protein ZHAS_00021358 [Anopheles sinensis]|uniref:Uncharacterized protein n=1 Tax=Anopheles sinensis TaxID=74873 RepID=A0A084WS68_ANOSI|nr:hypothetical protein ZHAS_00021358 [Anopheles sinensis]